MRLLESPIRLRKRVATRADLYDKSPISQWIASLYFSIATGTTVGYGDIHAVNSVEQVGGSLILLLAVAHITHFLARFGQIVSSLNAKEAERIKIKRDAMLFMHHRKVGQELYRKVLRYIEHTYGSQSLTSLEHTGFLEKLSKSLQIELRTAIIGHFLKHFPLFEVSDEVVLKAICQACTTQRAGKGDVVIEEGQANTHLYMILQGEVLVYQDVRLVGSLSHEDWFGERSLYYEDTAHHATLRCETDCEFLVLSRVEFLNQVNMFEQLRKAYEKLLTDLLEF